MNCAKYVGEKSTYIRTDRNRLGRGGNGEVFEVREDNSTGHIYAIKIYHVSSSKKIRYERFCQEIDFLEKVGNEIDGIIPIHDKHFPTETDVRTWYVMPKADNNFLEYYENKSLSEKLNAMLLVAKTLRGLHQREYAHRDIKPENILIYLGKPCLCDFGLLWGYGEKRLTYATERIGPISIMPPELDPVVPERDINYTLSDIYLFAKVLWMIIKNNNYGFTGPYQRNDRNVYLDREKYGVSTFEPIHELLEQATTDISLRININACINLIEQQLKVLYYDSSKDEILKEEIDQLVYKENTRSIISKYTPIVKEYTDMEVIEKMLDGTIKNADIFICERGKESKIEISDCIRFRESEFRFVGYFNRQIGIEYRIKIRKMLYNTQDETITLILDEYDKKADEDVRDLQIIRCLKKNHEIIIRSPNNMQPEQLTGQ